MTPRSLASLEVKLWSECLDSYDSMKRAAEKSDLSSSCSFAKGIPPARSSAHWAYASWDPCPNTLPLPLQCAPALCLYTTPLHDISAFDPCTVSLHRNFGPAVKSCGMRTNGSYRLGDMYWHHVLRRHHIWNSYPKSRCPAEHRTFASTACTPAPTTQKIVQPTVRVLAKCSSHQPVHRRQE